MNPRKRHCSETEWRQSCVMLFCMLGVPTKLKYSLKIVFMLARNYCLDGKISLLQGICRNYFAYYCDHVVAMVTV